MKSLRSISATILFGFLLIAGNVVVGNDDGGAEYGVDVSYPMHHMRASNNYPNLPWNKDPDGYTPRAFENMPVQPLGDRQAFYESIIDGCVKHYGERGNRCLDNEDTRVEMNLRQPASMYNYTKMGFTKIRAPDNVFRLIKEFWEANKEKAAVEDWPAGNTYVNHWDVKSKIISVEDRRLKGGGNMLKQHIWDAARSTIEIWTGQRLAECSLYGIRIYQEGSILATHVDRLPLVSSAIINVDQDVDEPWPLEVIGHDGKAYNVTMEPGDLVLYESHSVLHGRPFPLKGRFFANVFVHFEPVSKLGEEPIAQGDLPPYLIPGSADEPVWREQNPDGWELQDHVEFETGTTDAHHFSRDQDYGGLNRVLEEHEEMVGAKDENGWTPLHLAAREDSAAIVELLVERGADANAITLGGQTALNVARENHGTDGHPVVDFLEKIGAKDVGPEL